MTKLRRVNECIKAVVMLVYAALLMLFPEEGYKDILILLAIYLLVTGINQLLYYFSLAKYMVGGTSILLKSVLVINLGIEAAYLTDVPMFYIMLYLVGCLIFRGLVDILHALENKKNTGRNWKLKLVQGSTTMVIAIIGLINISSGSMVTYIFCLGIISSAITKITEACRKSDIVYIS